MIVETHATSHVGRVRRGNEDNYLLLSVADAKTWTSSQDANDFIVESQKFEVNADGVILAVSDGMGGALAGEVASKMAVDTISRVFLDEDPEKTLTPDIDDSSLVGKLYEATLYANHLIHQKGRADAQFAGMGATFTSVGITPEAIDLIQVGDSRTYLIRGEQIHQITKDQSLVQQLIDAQQILPEEAETHTLKNVILQALGAQKEIYPVSSRLIPQRGDILLLCSDGLSNKINAPAMQKIVRNNINQLQIAAAELIKKANINGGEDNITLILAKLTGDSLPEATEEAIKLETLDLGNIHDTADQNLIETL
ncbi:MAG: protein phosphatase 2C domain-containing protein [Pyrinomonadaceae bacterium]|jgi:protein phosphatase|nr:serine/threonine-protein phosphatase [Acidobacteriota bacterium]